MLGDALSSVGVIAAGIILLFTGWTWVDPAMSVLIGLIILAGAWRVLKEAIHILNEGRPRGRRCASSDAGLGGNSRGIRDTRCSRMDCRTGISGLERSRPRIGLRLKPDEPIMKRMKDLMTNRFDIEHTTIQFECATSVPRAVLF